MHDLIRKGNFPTVFTQSLLSKGEQREKEKKFNTPDEKKHFPNLSTQSLSEKHFKPNIYSAKKWWTLWKDCWKDAEKSFFFFQRHAWSFLAFHVSAEYSKANDGFNDFHVHLAILRFYIFLIYSFIHKLVYLTLINFDWALCSAWDITLLNNFDTFHYLLLIKSKVFT